MVLTPILGALADNQRSAGEKIDWIASAHGAVAATTAIAMGRGAIGLDQVLRDVMLSKSWAVFLIAVPFGLGAADAQWGLQQSTLTYARV